MKSLTHIIVVAGPTASGKSDYAITLAKKINGEVVSADSCQIYKGLDIGTGKVTQEEMNGVPHHMLDVLDINDNFSVAEYEKMALPLIDDILTRGKVPIICGGTGQYLDAIMYKNTPPRVPPNKQLRASLEKKTLEELFAELQKLDNERAETIDKYNRVRLVRALEIAYALGSVPKSNPLVPRYSVTMHLLNPPKELLEERIRTRLKKRLDHGMVEEFTGLIAKGYDAKTIARRGIGYKYIKEFLDGEYTRDAFIEKLTIAILRYAKRQRTWNKKYLLGKVPGIELHIVES